MTRQLPANFEIHCSNVAVHPDVLFRRLGDETVLVDMATNSIYELNRTAGRFWELLSQGQSEDEIKQQLLTEFDVSATHLEEEIRELLAELWHKGLLTRTT